MSTYIVGGAFFRIVREPQYPDLVTLLAERPELLESAHQAGPGAVCRSLDTDFPFALHAHYLSLPAEFGVITPRDLPLLEQPITPRPACWRWEGLVAGSSGEGFWEEHHGYVELDRRDSVQALLEADYRDLLFRPWFAPPPTPSKTAHSAIRRRQ